MPYREPSITTRRDPPDPDREARREERTLYGVVAAIGALPVAGALARGGAFGVEPTVGLVMLAAGGAGLIRTAWRGRRAPRSHPPE